jgi:precorrin-6B methylase 2
MLVSSRYLTPDDWFIDVGASVGAYTIYAIETGAGATAFEPDTEGTSTGGLTRFSGHG